MTTYIYKSPNDDLSFVVCTVSMSWWVRIPLAPFFLYGIEKPQLKMNIIYIRYTPLINSENKFKRLVWRLMKGLATNQTKSTSEYHIYIYICIYIYIIYIVYHIYRAETARARKRF